MARRDIFRYKSPVVGDFFVIGAADDGRLLVYSVSNDSGVIRFFLMLPGVVETLSRPVDSQIIEDDTIIDEFIAFKIVMKRNPLRASDRGQQAIMAAGVKHIGPKMMHMDNLADCVSNAVMS